MLTERRSNSSSNENWLNGNFEYFDHGVSVFFLHFVKMESLNHFYHCILSYMLKQWCFMNKGIHYNLVEYEEAPRQQCHKTKLRSLLLCIKTSHCSKYKRCHRQVYIYNWQCQKEITMCCPFLIPIKAQNMIIN